MQTILVVGNWSSGTTAVTGYLARLGGYTCPPTIQTSDPRTPDSHEPIALRNALAAVYDEMSLKKVGQEADFSKWLEKWLPQQRKQAALNGKKFIILKHPLSALLIGEINEVCAPRIVVVTRPFEEIEKTRLRRGWGPNYGTMGAQIIYPRAFSTFIEQQISFLSVDFRRFRKDQEERNAIIDYCGLTPDARKLAQAEDWVK